MRDDEADARRDKNGAMMDATVKRQDLDRVAITFRYPSGTVTHYVSNTIAIELIKDIGIAY